MIYNVRLEFSVLHCVTCLFGILFHLFVLLFIMILFFTLFISALHLSTLLGNSRM